MVKKKKHLPEYIIHTLGITEEILYSQWLSSPSTRETLTQSIAPYFRKLSIQRNHLPTNISTLSFKMSVPWIKKKIFFSIIYKFSLVFSSIFVQPVLYVVHLYITIDKILLEISFTGSFTNSVGNLFKITAGPQDLLHQKLAGPT